MIRTRSGMLMMAVIAAWSFFHAGTTCTATPAARMAMHVEADNQNDPGYAAYKAGYNLILEEKWSDARKKLKDMLAKYPQSEYADDARYWSTYALMHLDKKKAKAEYKEFVKQEKASSYYDDAVADLMSLEAPAAPMPPEPPDSLDIHVRIPRTPFPVISTGVGQAMRQVESNMRRVRWNLRRMGHGFHGSWGPMIAGANEEKLDPQTRLKLDALAAIGESKEDEKGFQTLRTMALDQKQPAVLREEAMRQLADFQKHDVATVFLDIARKDTSEEMQTAAVSYLRQSGRDKDKTYETLAELYRTLPKQRTEQRAAVLYEIADIGNDQSVDFLTKVAESSEEYDLRSDAIYYLGNIGGDKARAALYRILESK